MSASEGQPGREQTYSISELCKEFDVTPRTLRFYEQKGLLHPARRGWTRIFSYRDRVRLQLILRGRRVQGAFMGDNNFRADMQNYIELDRQGKIDVGSLIEKHIHLGDINDGYDAMRARKINGRRVIMFPT